MADDPKGTFDTGHETEPTEELNELNGTDEEIAASDPRNAIPGAVKKPQ